MVRAQLLHYAIPKSTALPKAGAEEAFEAALGDLTRTLLVHMTLVMSEQRVSASRLGAN